MPLNTRWGIACGVGSTPTGTTNNSINTGVAQWIESYASNVVDEGPSPSACAIVNLNRVNPLTLSLAVE